MKITKTTAVHNDEHSNGILIEGLDPNLVQRLAHKCFGRDLISVKDSALLVRKNCSKLKIRAFEKCAEMADKSPETINMILFRNELQKFRKADKISKRVGLQSIPTRKGRLYENSCKENPISAE